MPTICVKCTSSVILDDFISYNGDMYCSHVCLSKSIKDKNIIIREDTLIILQMFFNLISFICLLCIGLIQIYK